MSQNLLAAGAVGVWRSAAGREVRHRKVDRTFSTDLGELSYPVPLLSTRKGRQHHDIKLLCYESEKEATQNANEFRLSRIFTLI
jgi:hypothetical protein